jgi:hypothetical protein
MSHYYILYRIKNKVNNKFYIGVHKTNNIHDDYLGSGHKIKAAIEKYGKENFEKEIIQIFTNSIEAFNKEKELVTNALVKDNMCYNIKEGGHGGFDHIRSVGLHRSVKGTKVMHNPNTGENKKVKPELVDQYLLDGWNYGYSIQARKRMSEGGKIKIQSQEQKKKNSETKKNARVMIHITSGIKKFIKKPLIKEYEKEGWRVYEEQFRRIY